jgi:hypothetical protein
MLQSHKRKHKDCLRTNESTLAQTQDGIEITHGNMNLNLFLLLLSKKIKKLALQVTIKDRIHTTHGGTIKDKGSGLIHGRAYLKMANTSNENNQS